MRGAKGEIYTPQNNRGTAIGRTGFYNRFAVRSARPPYIFKTHILLTNNFTTMKANESNNNGQKVQTLNSKQFAAMLPNLSQHAGVILVYTGATDAQTALRFYGDDFTPKNGKQDEAFRCWKNIYTVFRTVKQAETELREKNDGIRSKLRAGTPSQIYFVTEEGKVVQTYELTDSIWKSVGLVPTKKDLEKTGRDLKKSINDAARASFTAIGMRDLLPKESEPVALDSATDATEKAA